MRNVVRSNEAVPVSRHAAHGVSVLPSAGIAPANLIGSSDATRSLRASITRAAARLPVCAMVVGGYGVGKKNVAAAIHREGADNNPLVVIDCNRDSAHDFLRRYINQLRADGNRPSTLLLDAPERLPYALQRELALCLTECRRHGADMQGSQPSVLATVRDSVAHLVDAGELSTELVTALGSLVLAPSLKARADDIIELVERFVATLNSEFGKSCTIAPELIQYYQRYDWPGNVRELKRVTATLFHATDEGGQLRPDRDLAPELFTQDQAEVGPLIGLSLDYVGQKLLIETLAQYDGDKRRTAEALGISIKTLYNRLRKYRRDADPAT